MTPEKVRRLASNAHGKRLLVKLPGNEKMLRVRATTVIALEDSTLERIEWIGYEFTDTDLEA